MTSACHTVQRAPRAEGPFRSATSPARQSCRSALGLVPRVGPGGPGRSVDDSESVREFEPAVEPNRALTCGDAVRWPSAQPTPKLLERDTQAIQDDDCKVAVLVEDRGEDVIAAPRSCTIENAREARCDNRRITLRKLYAHALLGGLTNAVDDRPRAMELADDANELDHDRLSELGSLTKRRGRTAAPVFIWSVAGLRRGELPPWLPFRPGYVAIEQNVPVPVTPSLTKPWTPKNAP